MNYCDQLHFHMNFLPTCISPCCDVHRAGAPEFPFTGGYVDFEKYTKHIEDVREKIQNPPNAFCTDCPNIYIYIYIRTKSSADGYKHCQHQSSQILL